MSRASYASKQKRRRQAIPTWGMAGLSLSLCSSSIGTASASGGGATPAPVPHSICGDGFPMGLAGCY
jgi:hypothetical protein